MPGTVALLIIDVQVGIFDGLRPHQWDETVSRIAALLTARAAGVPVIYVQHADPPGGSLEPGTPGWAIHPAIQPRPGEPVVSKQACDSFFETTLQHELDSRGITRVVVAGCMTQYCIDTSCRRAVSLGYDVTLVADGHTTADTEVLRGAQIVAHHNDVLRGFNAGSHSIEVIPAKDIVHNTFEELR